MSQESGVKAAFTAPLPAMRATTATAQLASTASSPTTSFRHRAVRRTEPASAAPPAAPAPPMLPPLPQPHGMAAPTCPSSTTVAAPPVVEQLPTSLGRPQPPRLRLLGPRPLLSQEAAQGLTVPLWVAVAASGAPAVAAATAAPRPLQPSTRQRGEAAAAAAAVAQRRCRAAFLDSHLGSDFSGSPGVVTFEPQPALERLRVRRAHTQDHWASAFKKLEDDERKGLKEKVAEEEADDGKSWTTWAKDNWYYTVPIGISALSAVGGAARFAFVKARGAVSSATTPAPEAAPETSTPAAEEGGGWLSGLGGLFGGSGADGEQQGQGASGSQDNRKSRSRRHREDTDEEGSETKDSSVEDDSDNEGGGCEQQ
mmetsp:Transcript_100760/g.215996  ORF Transcript_100760/g.215996 Transcript_100760/m.215996 type:complete len:369 (-) Transcript_100760:29-1135(-)